MARNMKTIRESHINFFIKESIIKGVNGVKLVNIEIKIGYNSYKSFENTCSKRSGIRVLKSSLLKIFINYKPSFISSKVLILVCFIGKNLYY
jgi:hypothetical protein